MHIGGHGGPNPFQQLGRLFGHHGGHIDRHDHGHHRGRGHRGPSEVELSRSTQRLESVKVDGNSAEKMSAERSDYSLEQSGFDNRRSFIKAAKSVIKQAVKGLARDVGKAFESMGLDGAAAKDLVKGLIRPMMQALRSGADFTAQLQMAAVQKTTVIAGGEISESLSVVAKSVDISVNHSTGEISVDVESLKIEKESVASLEAPAAKSPVVAPPPFLGPPDVAPPPPPVSAQPQPAAKPDDDDSSVAPRGLGEIVERVLDAARTQREELGDDNNGIEGDIESGEPVKFDPAIEVLLPNADAEEKGAAQVEALRSTLSIQAAQRFQNEAGELITRLRVDAKISLTRVLEVSPEAVFELSAAKFQARVGLDIEA